MRTVAGVACALVALGAVAQGALPAKPSRASDPQCRWERFDDAAVGLAAWVEHCDYGSRRIDFVARGRSLAIRYSDGGEPEALVDVIDLGPGESASAAVRRVFAAATDAAVAGRCVLSAYRDPLGARPPAGVRRYTFVPNPGYRRALKAKQDPNEIPDPPCGDLGDAPDGIQYFEVRGNAASGRLLFVRIGQDTPLFDDATLTPLKR